MRLITRIILTLAAALLPLMTLWCILFSYTMITEINEEADESLERYATFIISRCRDGRILPSLNSGSDLSYTLEPVSDDIATEYITPIFYDEEVYIAEYNDDEPARVMKIAFDDYHGRHLLLKVAMPTYEKDDLLETILGWTASLFAFLIIAVIAVATLSIRGTLRPLYTLLKWLEGYKPGYGHVDVPNNTTIHEFILLNKAAQNAVDRSEELLDKQKQFIGNASHELQTPLAVISNRIEHIIDNTNPSEEQLSELMKIDHSLRHSIRLNRTLLQLMRIESGEVADSSNVDIIATLNEIVNNCKEIYNSKEISCDITSPESLHIYINESLLRTLIINLVKNAFIHSNKGATISIKVTTVGFYIANNGDMALDSNRVFDRFYTRSSREGSTGLGLAIVKSICDHYGFVARYTYKDGYHLFSIDFDKTTRH